MNAADRIKALAEFVAARYDEDEQVARAASAEHWQAEIHHHQRTGKPVSYEVHPVAEQEGNGDGGIVTAGDAVHIARHDPARALADVESKRQLVADLLAEEHFLNDREWYGCRAVTEAPHKTTDVPTGRACTCGRDERVERRLRLLAEPFSGHADYSKPDAD